MSNKEKDPKQETPRGHEIPIPKKGEFFDNLKKVSKSADDEEPAGPKRVPDRPNAGGATPSATDPDSDPSGGGEEE